MTPRAAVRFFTEWLDALHAAERRYREAAVVDPEAALARLDEETRRLGFYDDDQPPESAP